MQTFWRTKSIMVFLKVAYFADVLTLQNLVVMVSMGSLTFWTNQTVLHILCILYTDIGIYRVALHCLFYEPLV